MTHRDNETHGWNAILIMSVAQKSAHRTVVVYDMFNDAYSKYSNKKPIY